WKDYGSAELPRNKSGLLELWDQDTQSLGELWAKVTSERLQAKEIAFGQWPGRVFGHILYAIDNESHHRAQGYVYLRALGVEPPPFWERCRRQQVALRHRPPLGGRAHRRFGATEPPFSPSEGAVLVHWCPGSGPFAFRAHESAW